MSYDPVVIGLRITDRRTSYDFYRHALALEAIGEPDEDGIPEPLQFAVNTAARVMLIPRGGFELAVGYPRRHRRPHPARRHRRRRPGHPSRPPAMGIRRRHHRPRRAPVDDPGQHITAPSCLPAGAATRRWEIAG